MRACQYVGLFAGLSLLSACDARPLFQRFSEPNADNCMSSGLTCADGQTCNGATEICEPTFELTAVEPDLAPSRGGTRVELVGRNLRPDVMVRFGPNTGALATDITLIDSTRLSLTVPPNPTPVWAVPISVEVPGQSVSKSGLFSYYSENPVFELKKIEPFIPTKLIYAVDINNDMHSDLLFVSTTTNDSTLLLSLGSGTGSFTTGPSFFLSNRLVGTLTLRDINNDGYVDILVGSTKGLDVFINNKQGSFQPAQFFSTGAGTPTVLSIAVGDWNHDGSPDVAAVNETANNVVILQNNGSGGFLTAVPIESGTTPVLVLSGDFDGNQAADLVTLSQSTPVQVRLGDNQSNFPMSSAPSVSGCTAEYADAADLNGNGTLDLVVQCANNTIRVLLGNGNGTFANGDAAAATLGSGTASVRLAMADFDGDRRLDILAGVKPLGTRPIFYLLRGDGKGGFPSMTNLFMGEDQLSSVAQADLNGDGKPDFVFTSVESQLVFNRSP